jgi:hypothetical protein
VADNERYLRDLDFILDSRIFVIAQRDGDGSDSVDLLVMTRDVFSIGVVFNPYGPTHYRVRIQDANFLGMGQRLMFTSLYLNTRTPRFGQEFLYRKINLFGSFINGTVGYTNIDNAASLGNENESSLYFQLNRALVHPFTRWAGGLELSRNYSSNVYTEPENLFAKYSYTIQDLWTGYSFGHARLPNSQLENRNRKFIAIRGYHKNFTETPTVPLYPKDKLLYRDRVAILGQLTFFKQDFYRTKYVLGFGRTEDVPYGYRASLTGGWEKENGSQSPYLSVDLYRNRVNEGGMIYSYGGKIGTYWSRDQFQDALVQFNVTRFSKVYPLGKSNVRHWQNIGYAQQFNQQNKNGLNVGGSNGILGFQPDSLSGARRLIFQTEATVYTPWKILGFRLAPVARMDLAFLAKANGSFFQKSNYFSGHSVALMARNENLIFNTVEARFYYYPRTVENIANTRFELRTNLRIKYPTNLVTPPGTVYDP